MADEDRNDIRIEAALAKLYGSEMGWLMADELVQIRGGRGFETADSLAARGERAVPAEQMLRDLRINRIFEGSTEIMHLLIAREAVDAHLSVAGDIIDPDKTLADKARAGGQGRRLLRPLAAQARSPDRANSRVRTSEFHPAGHPDLSAHLRYVERAARKLARSTFYAMSRWQGRMETKQGFLGRIVDIGAELFAMSAACVRAEIPARPPGSTAARRTSWPTCSAGRPGSASRSSSAGCGPTPTTSTARSSTGVLDGTLHLAGGGHHRPQRRRPLDRRRHPGPEPDGQRPPAHPLSGPRRTARGRSGSAGPAPARAVRGAPAAR